MRIRIHALLVTCLLLYACGDSAPPLPGLSHDATILAFGDSLTYGTGATREESYPAILEQLIGRKVINAGIPGEVSSQGLQRLPDMLDKYRPQLLILCHGGNDILRKQDLKKMESNIKTMVRLAQDRGIAVILLGVPEFGLFLSSSPVYREIAQSTKVVFIEDLIPEILSDRDLKADAVHPNRNGYRKIAEWIHTLLQDAGSV